MSKKSPKKTEADPAVLAEAIAQQHFARSVDFVEMIEQNEPAFEQIRKCFGAPEGRVIGKLAGLEDKLRAVLPETEHRMLRDYSDLSNDHVYASMEAAFLIGVAFGRQLGGAR